MTHYKKLILIRHDCDSTIVVDSDNIVKIEPSILASICEPRREREFKDHAIYLNPDYDYVLGKDSGGALCLIVLYKGKTGP